MLVSEIMSRELVTISSDKRVSQALQLMQQRRIRHLPVLEGDRLVGVITMLDLIGAFLTLLSLLRTSSRLDLLLEDKPEAVEGAAKIIKKAGGKILNLALGPVRGHQRSYCVRLQRADLGPIVEALEQQGIKVQDIIP
ncbi:MAG: CBS domain-containing protein [Desulfobaccales bacterium]|jgi:acetoin utilization protein AcuB